MTTQPLIRLTRRRLLCSSAALAAWAVGGCHRQQESDGSASKDAEPSRVPLRVTLVGHPGDEETILRGWLAVADHPLDISLVPVDRSQPAALADSVLTAANRTDVLVLPLGWLAEAVERELVVPLTGDEFEEADVTLGAMLPAVRNGAARYAGESYAIPLGAAQPLLLSTEEMEPLDSWQAYDQQVEAWQGQAAEPTAPGWAAAMFLWRSASERDWLFSRERLEPLIQEAPYVRALEQMVQTCARYQHKQQTPQQIWEAVASSAWRGGIGFPEQRTGLESNLFLQPLPGTTDASRVLLDPFSPVAAMAASCRQSAVAQRFMIWISGGEGSATVRRQVRGMTDTRSQSAVVSDVASTAPSGYDLQLQSRLASPVTMPTLQLLSAGEYYRALDDQVLRAVAGDVEPEQALAEVADRWQGITERIGVDKQRRVWRRAQGMRS